MIELRQIAEELNMSPQLLRNKLRRHGIKKEKGWRFKPGEIARIKELATTRKSRKVKLEPREEELVA
jgi:hypothetical protein